MNDGQRLKVGRWYTAQTHFRKHQTFKPSKQQLREEAETNKSYKIIITTLARPHLFMLKKYFKQAFSKPSTTASKVNLYHNVPDFWGID